MKKTLILFSSVDGQTEKICSKIYSEIKKNDDVKIISIEESKLIDINNFDKIIIGASIRYGKHRKGVYDFIKNNKSILEQKFTAFFTVNIVARKSGKNTPETNPYVKKFLKISKWTPDVLEVFAGKLEYPKYGFFDKHAIRFIMWITKGPTNINEIYEFTDWVKVETFAKSLS